MKNLFAILLIIANFLITISVSGQDADSTKKVKEKIKKGWSFGAVPAIAFDSDIGFKYGGVINFFHYGDGTIYPKYKHSLFFEVSTTTKGSSIYQFIYDSKYLIPNVRLTFESSYLTERALDFYGYNGYEALYNSKYEDDTDPEYLSRQYYRQERKLFRLRADFQGRFLNDKTRWLAGLTNYNVQTDTIDINRLNKDKSEEDKLPPVNGGLYGEYVYNWHIIPDDQISGGNTTLLKAGLVLDTRDNEPNPMRGVWTDVLFIWAPGFIGNGDYSFAKIAITHRQYITLIRNRLTFVYRLGYQGKLWGDMPVYMLPIIFNGGQAVDRDGLGGAKTIRGILRDRIVGEDYLYGNLEFRWKFFQTVFMNQNLYFALNTFSDFGMVTGKYEIDKTYVPASDLHMFPDKNESLHVSYGGGFHLALNQNFVVAINYGIAASKNDGGSGIYIGLNWLF